MTKKKQRPKLTEAEWRRVFTVRCNSKRGFYMSPEDTKLIEAAYREDADRYRAMDIDIHNETRPFGAKEIKKS